MPQKISKNTSVESLSDQVVIDTVLNLAPERAIFDGKVNNFLDPFSSLISETTSIAVAVSGGADSMALSILLADLAENKPRKIVALTVDHGLRENSAGEARKVANWLAPYGVEHKTLLWKGKKPINGVQAGARNARYDLMATWCRKNKFTVLMTAHHLEDQIETFLMRTERGSGLDGLASMCPVVALKGVMLIRPLLSVSKVRLRAFLREKEQVWIEDPSNNNLAFQRARIRQLVEKLESRGLLPAETRRLIVHLAVLRQQFSSVVKLFFERAVRIMPETYGIVHFEALKYLPDPVLERVLVQIIFELSGNFYPPRRQCLKLSIEKIKSIETINFTLGGCRFIFEGSKVIVCRDQRSISKKQVVAGNNFNWDGLFQVVISGPTGVTGRIGPLGKKGWIKIVEKCPELKNIPIPHPVRLTLPALFDDNEVVEVPSLKYRCGDSENLALSISKQHC
jgi:tRNA(Ile)-lysidine synthase